MADKSLGKLEELRRLWLRRWSDLRWRWRREWRRQVLSWWWWRGRFLILLILLVVLGVVFLANGWIEPISENQLQRLPPILLTAGVFLVSLPGAYLVNRHFEFREQQSDRLEQYWSLQQKFTRYQSAFWELRRALERHYGVDGQYGRDYDELTRSLDFWDNPDENRPMAVMFVRNLWQASEHHWRVGNPTIGERLISPDWLDHLHTALGSLNGVLSRSKHYRPLLSQLGPPLPEGSDYRTHTILPPKWVRILERVPIVRDRDGDPSTLGFWEQRFMEAYDLLDEMKTHALYIFGGPPQTIRAIMRELSLLTFVAVVVPLGLLSFRVPDSTLVPLTYFSILGFFAALYLIGATLYTEVMQSSVIRDRRGTEREN